MILLTSFCTKLFRLPPLLCERFEPFVNNLFNSYSLWSVSSGPMYISTLPLDIKYIFVPLSPYLVISSWGKKITVFIKLTINLSSMLLQLSKMGIFFMILRYIWNNIALRSEGESNFRKVYISYCISGTYCICSKYASTSLWVLTGSWMALIRLVMASN